MRMIRQFQYFPETKHKADILVLLDNAGNVWICHGPLMNGTRWHKVLLPADLDVEDDDAISD
jgi:hypothetical protein